MAKCPQGELLRKYEDIVQAQARKRQGTRNDLEKEHSGHLSGMLEKTKGEAHNILGAMANVSGKTYDRATAVMDNAPAEVIQAVSLHYSRMCPTFGRVSNGLIPSPENGIEQEREILCLTEQGVYFFLGSPVVDLPPTSAPMKSRDTLGTVITIPLLVIAIPSHM